MNRTVMSFVAFVIMFSSNAALADELYRVDIDNIWSEQTHPGNFPFEAHFSWFGVGIHSDAVSFWNVGEVASPGMVRMAETGVTTGLVNEVNTAVNRGEALEGFEVRKWFCPPGTTHNSCGGKSIMLRVKDEFPLVTLVSMLGPSPDWFVGVSGLSLQDGGAWIETKTIDLHPYDGGTRSANVWALHGPQNNPPEPISIITTESGQLVGPDLMGTMQFNRLNRGDVNGDGDLRADDIDAISIAARSGGSNLMLDMNGDAIINDVDRTHWVETLANTYFGDSNLDGEFNSTDFIAVFQAGLYEDGDNNNATWASGDWSGDGEFDSADFIKAFQAGGYEKGMRTNGTLVPEPTPWNVVILIGFVGLAMRSRVTTSSGKTH